jgi:hypothetical protein
MVSGQPNLNIQPVSRAHATLSPVMSRIGTTSGQRVKCLTVVRQYVLHNDVGRGPRGPCGLEENRLSPNGVIVWRVNLKCWQDWQPHVHVWQTFCTPGHTKCHATSFAIVFVPGCYIMDGLEHLELWGCWNIRPSSPGRGITVDGHRGR